jgi:hypothetical protein
MLVLGYVLASQGCVAPRSGPVHRRVRAGRVGAIASSSAGRAPRETNSASHPHGSHVSGFAGSIAGEPRVVFPEGSAGDDAHAGEARAERRTPKPSHATTATLGARGLVLCMCMSLACRMGLGRGHKNAARAFKMRIVRVTKRGGMILHPIMQGPIWTVSAGVRLTFVHAASSLVNAGARPIVDAKVGHDDLVKLVDPLVLDQSFIFRPAIKNARDWRRTQERGLRRRNLGALRSPLHRDLHPFSNVAKSSPQTRRVSA